MNDKSTLRKHKNSVHESVWYDCDKCDHKSSDKSNLTKHIQSKHEGVRYACDQCDYQSKHTNNLTKHIHTRHEFWSDSCCPPSGVTLSCRLTHGNTTNKENKS